MGLARGDKEQCQSQSLGPPRRGQSPPARFLGHQCTPTSTLLLLERLLEQGALPGSACFLLPTEVFPWQLGCCTGRGTARAVDSRQSGMLGTVQSPGWVPACIRPMQTFKGIPDPCFWCSLLFLGTFMYPKGKLMGSSIHPLALQASQSGSGWLQPPHSVWQGGSRAVLPSTNPIKRSTALSCSSKL